MAEAAVVFTAIGQATVKKYAQEDLNPQPSDP